MILSNLSTPLLGLVDTAVMGHLDAARFLAAVALGGVLFSFLYWGFGFLRMSTTGLTAHAFGENDGAEIRAILLRAALLSQCLAFLIILLGRPLAQLGFGLMDGTAGVKTLAGHYVDIRIWSAPATLALYVLNGWFLGMQNAKVPLLIVLVTNLTNIGLDFWFVSALHWTVSGVAWASVVAEYTGLLVGIILLLRYLPRSGAERVHLLDSSRIKNLLLINSHILIRTWCLIFAFAFFTAQGARFGETILAANAVLLNFQTFMAYALDGFAHAAEALVGRSLGEKNRALFDQSVMTAAFWSLFVACAFTAFYALYGGWIIDLLTGLDGVRRMAYRYLPWSIVMPLAAFVCYLFDGVFIGATWFKPMRDAMLFALLIGYLPAWYLTCDWGNHGLWLAMLVFMLARGVSMGWLFRKLRISILQH